MAPSGGVSPPSLLALLGNRCRKRHFFFDDSDETDLDPARSRKAAQSDLLKHAAHVTPVQLHSSGNFQERRNNAIAKSTLKRLREDSDAPKDRATAKGKDKMVSENQVDAEITDTEDNRYNSFQFWRTPLPELDMSLLQNPPKDCDAMEI